MCCSDKLLQVYFDFLLIPMTMAYLLTFLLGPLFDFFYQRPLLCFGFRCCCASNSNCSSWLASLLVAVIHRIP